MHRNNVRLALAAIAAFYAIFGGLWATNYFPLQASNSQIETMDRVKTKYKDLEYMKDAEYIKAQEALTKYVVTHPDDSVIEGRISLYQSILLWGTVALMVGALVMFLTRKTPAR